MDNNTITPNTITSVGIHMFQIKCTLNGDVVVWYKTADKWYEEILLSANHFNENTYLIDKPAYT